MIGQRHRYQSPAIRLGTQGPWYWPRTISLSLAEIRHHWHLLGATGAGKSRLLAQLVVELIQAGQAVTLLDPDGDLARLVVTRLVAAGRLATPTDRARITYLDLPAAERAGRYLPLNVLDQPGDPHTVASHVLEALRRAWPALDGGQAPTFENLVLAGSVVLVHHQLPLTRLHDLLVDRAFRDRLLASLPDEAVVRFFHQRYDRWHREQPLLIESSLRRIFLLSFSPILRASLGQPDNLLQFRERFDRGQSLIVNLALPDGDARRLLGCLLTVAAEQAALTRTAQPLATRGPDHYLILDEATEFTARSATTLAEILVRCRKVGLWLVLAHQTWDQASGPLQSALQGAGIEVVFRLGRVDAERTAGIIGRTDPATIKHVVPDPVASTRTHPVFAPLAEQREHWIQTIQDLPDRQAFLRRPSGQVTRFRVWSTPDPVIDPECLAQIEQAYLDRYFRPVTMVMAEPSHPSTRLATPLLSRSEPDR